MIECASQPLILHGIMLHRYNISSEFTVKRHCQTNGAGLAGC